MKRRLRTFVTSDSGAVTVDWVVLTAGVITVIMLVFTAVSDDTLGLAGKIERNMGSR